MLIEGNTRREKPKEISPLEIDTSTLEGQLFLGELRANTMRHRIIESGELEANEFGGHYFASLNFLEFTDHGHQHARHVEKTAKRALREYDATYPGELTSENTDTLADLSALMLFPYFHDADQGFTAVRNQLFIEREVDGHLPVKKGHAVAAGILTMALTKHYADAAQISFDDAWNITAPVAVMMMRHNNPERFEHTFGLENKISLEEQQDLHGEELLDAFHQDTLDLYSLSPSQYFEIMRMQKEPSAFFEDYGDGESRYGLAPIVEQEFVTELEELATQTDPIMMDLSDERRERLKTLAEIAYFADTADMISPWLFQFNRTLLTQYSRERPFSIFRGKGQPDVDEVFEMVLNGNGTDPSKSDDIRFLWEMIHVNGTETKLNQVPWVQQFYKEHVYLGMRLLGLLGKDIMRIKYIPEDDMNKFEEITLMLMMSGMDNIDMFFPIDEDPGICEEQKQVKEWADNVLEGLEIIQLLYLFRARRLKETIDGLKNQKYESSEKHHEMCDALDESYKLRCSQFCQEMIEVVRSLQDKRLDYTQEDIHNFMYLIKKVFVYLQKKYQISVEELKSLSEIFFDGKNAPSQPFTNDALSSGQPRILGTKQ